MSKKSITFAVEFEKQYGNRLKLHSSMNQKFLVWFNVVAGVASIIGVVLCLLQTEISAYIALISFVLFLLSIIGIFCYYVITFTKNEFPDEYVKLSVFSSYETSDGVKGVYERYRIIQSKRPVLSYIFFQFKWTGSKSPVLSSGLQKIEGEPIDGGADYDKIKLVFNKPLLFNETATIHFRAEVNDVDGIAQPYDCYKVDQPIQLIHFRITLKHKPDGYKKTAMLQRCRINGVIHPEYEDIDSVSFDNESKSYLYDLTNPEVGYFYRLVWEK